MMNLRGAGRNTEVDFETRPIRPDLNFMNMPYRDYGFPIKIVLHVTIPRSVV